MAKKSVRKKRAASRSWVPFVGGFVTVAIVAGMFWLAGRGGEQETAQATASQPVRTQPAQPMSQPAEVVTPAQIAAVERITAEETKRLLDSGEAVTIDVRDVQSYVAGHIPGAMQIPLQYVSGEIPWFPRDKKIITYCT